MPTITATTYETFPRCPTYGFRSRPRYLVKGTRREGGAERRDRKWQEPLHSYEGVPLGNAVPEDMEAVLEFFHAMGGTWGAFRFKDWVDYKSCRVRSAPTPADQPFIAIDSTHFQLVKQYVRGSRITVRTIVLPKGNTIRVQNQSGAEQTSWTIDENTGILTKGVGFSGTPGAWGGEFYARCKFDTDIELEIVSHEIVGCTASLQELRPEDT